MDEIDEDDERTDQDHQTQWHILNTLCVMMNHVGRIRGGLLCLSWQLPNDDPRRDRVKEMLEEEDAAMKQFLLVLHPYLTGNREP